MVTVTGYQARKTEQGKEFFVLTVQGGIEVVQSQSGKTYLTARKASLSTTFDEATCQALVGQQLRGSITKVEVEPYQFTTDQGEVIMRNHRYEYTSEEPLSAVEVNQYSTNGPVVDKTL